MKRTYEIMAKRMGKVKLRFKCERGKMESAFHKMDIIIAFNSIY